MSDIQHGTGSGGGHIRQVGKLKHRPNSVSIEATAVV